MRLLGPNTRRRGFWLLAGVTWSLAGCDLFDPGGPAPDDLLEIQACFDTLGDSVLAPCKLDADGVSDAVVRVRFKEIPAFRSEDREVKIRTSAGELIAGSGQGTEVKVKTAGGIATVGLRSSRDPGNVTVAAVAESITVDASVSFEPAFPSQLRLRPKGGRVAKADGTAAIQLVAELQRPPGMGQASKGLRVEFVPFVQDSAGIATEVVDLSAVSVVGGTPDATVSLRSLQHFDSLFVFARMLDLPKLDSIVSIDTVLVQFDSTGTTP